MSPLPHYRRPPTPSYKEILTLTQQNIKISKRNVRLTKLLSFDIVSEPGFSNAKFDHFPWQYKYHTEIVKLTKENIIQMKREDRLDDLLNK